MCQDGRMSTAPTLLLLLTMMAPPESVGGPGGGKGSPATALLEKGSALFRKGDVAGALQAFDGAARADPPMPDLTICVGWHWRKKATRLGRRQPTAPPWRGRRLRRGPQQPGRAGPGQGGRRDRGQEFRGGGQGGPAYPEAYFNLGVARDAFGGNSNTIGKTEKRGTTDQTGKTDNVGHPDAVGAYREAVRLKPAEPSYRLNLGAALRRQGDFDGALSAFREATRLAPQDPLGWVNLGMIQSDQKAYDEAVVSLERATKLNPEYALAWNRLGRVELRRGHLDRAVDLQERARKLDPKNGAVAADLCRTLIEKRDANQAIAACRAAVALDPQNPLARYEFGKALVAKGDCAEARKEMDRFRHSPGSSRRRGRRQTRLPERAASGQVRPRLRTGRRRRKRIEE